MRWVFVVTLTALLAAAGCGVKNPVKRAPKNVFYGTREFDERAAKLSISPDQAVRLAMEKARIDERARGEQRQQYISRHPTFLHERIYVFSMSRPDGASLKGYHVDGDSGLAQFYTLDEFVKAPAKSK